MIYMHPKAHIETSNADSGIPFSRSSVQLGTKKTSHILLHEVTVFNCSCLIEGCTEV